MTQARQAHSWLMERPGRQMSAGLWLTVPLFRLSNSCCPSISSEAMLQAGLVTRSTDTQHLFLSTHLAQRIAKTESMSGPQLWPMCLHEGGRLELPRYRGGGQISASFGLLR